MPKLNNALRALIGDQITSLTSVDVYSGSIPATGGTAPTGTLLVSWSGTLTWGGTITGVNTLSGTPLTSSAAVATGTAGYARLWDGSSASMYCTVSTSGADINLSSLSVVASGTVTITSATVTVPAT